MASHQDLTEPKLTMQYSASIVAQVKCIRDYHPHSTIYL